MSERSAVVVALGLAGCSMGLGYRDHPTTPPPPVPAAFAWPEREGWKRDVVVLPERFRGAGESRIASDGSTVFVWFIEEGPRLERIEIEKGLVEVHGNATSAKLVADREPGLVGSIDWAGTSESATRLHVKVTIGACGTRRFVLVRESERPFADPIWSRLSQVAASFQCVTPVR